MVATGKPWRDKEVLKELYHNQEMSMGDVANHLGCSTQTVKNWLDKYEMETREWVKEDADYRNESLLRELYVEKELSLNEIADRLDCSSYSVGKYMEKYDIERRCSNREKPLKLHTNKSGYEYFSGYSGNRSFNARHHRLIAVATGDLSPNEFINGEKNIHHKNGIPWDNRHGNIEPLSISEHAEVHDKERERDGYGRYS